MTQYIYLANRVLDKNGIADSSSIFFYLSGTTTLIDIYSDPDYTIQLPNPLRMVMGAAIPPVYWQEGSVRVVVIDSSGEIVSDDDPYSPFGVEVLSAALASDEGAEMVGLPQGGTLADAIKWITPESRDASVLALDNSAAITAAASLAASLGVDLLLNGIYPCASTVTFPANLTVRGLGREVSGIVSNANIAVSVSGGVTLQDLNISTSGASHICVWAVDVDAPQLFNCKLNGRVYCRNGTSVERFGPRIENCDFDVDFGADYDGIAQMDVVSIYGYFGAWVESCTFDVANIHRLFKVSGSTETEYDVLPSPRNTRAFTFKSNIVRGKGGKQVFDLFLGTSGGYFINNHFELSNDAGLVGNRWTAVIENKTASGQRDINDIGAALVVDGNTGVVGGASFVSVQGNYGITQLGYTGDRFNSLKVVNNHIRKTASSTDPVITARYFNHIYDDGNTWEAPKVALQPVLSYYSSENITIGSGTMVVGGHIDIRSSFTNAGVLTFSGAIGSVHIGACLITNFDSAAAITFTDVTAEHIVIKGARSRPAPSPTQTVRAVRFTSSVAIGRINITEMDATHPSAGAVEPVLDVVSSAALGLYRDNNWQPRFRGYFAAIPTTGTYLRGDTIKMSSPNLNGPTEYTCITGNSTGGVWSLSAHSTRRGTTATRPSLGAADVGLMYMDTTLVAGGKPIWWTGLAWVDATGTSV